jgi:hypothetical protein
LAEESAFRTSDPRLNCCLHGNVLIDGEDVLVGPFGHRSRRQYGVPATGLVLAWCEEFLLRMRVNEYVRFLDLVACWYLKQRLVRFTPLDISK